VVLSLAGLPEPLGFLRFSVVYNSNLTFFFLLCGQTTSTITPRRSLPGGFVPTLARSFPLREH